MKNTIKIALSSLVKFMACNLLGFVPGFIAAAQIEASYTMRAQLELANLIIYGCMTVGFMIAFYVLYIYMNKNYKDLYIRESYEGHSIKSIMCLHIKTFTKYELPIIFVLSIAMSFVPSVILGRLGISFLFMSAGFFADFLPAFLFGSEAFICRLIGFVLWDIYIVVCYFGCLRVAYWRWNKKRLKKPKV